MTITVQREVDAALAAAQCVVRTHERLVEFLKAGQTLREIDAFVAECFDDLDCTSAFLRYRIPQHPPYPSFACLSPNDCIVHGTHDMIEKPIEPGDVLSIDIGVKHHGFVGDAAWTYAIEHASDLAQRMMKCGREALRRGVEAMQPGRPLIDFAKAVQPYVESECGFFLAKGLFGHGYGRKLHEAPSVSNLLPAYPGEWPDAWKVFKPGMLLAVEPMIAAGTREIRSERNKWPIFTADGSLAVHYEADVLVTSDGPRVLTDGMEQLPDIVG
jgi:methionyl aminopeptidase